MTDLPPVPARMPEPPRRAPPAGACDTHAHVFGPYARYPLVHPAAFAMPLAPPPSHLEMLARAGLDRGVLVQPGAYAEDHSCLLEALAGAGGRVRGVGLATRETADDVLDRLHRVGVRACRFTEMRNPDGTLRAGAVGVEEAIALAPRLRRRGWHIQLWAPIDAVIAQAPRLADLGLPVVVDHMGMLDAGAGTSDARFQRLVALVREGLVWVKLSLCRVSARAPRYDDLRPFHQMLVEANPQRLLWGSDWPYIRLDPAPDVGALVDLFQDWVSDEAVVRTILVDNPAALFAFDGEAA